MKKITKTVLTVFACVGLSACSSLTDKTKSASVVDASSAYASGIGQQTGFDGQEDVYKYRMVAPHDQVYYFNFDNSKIQSSDRASIELQAKYVKEHPGITLVLLGHTDTRGSREYNMALGERRAKSVHDLIMLAGVPSRQVCVISYGEERPAMMGSGASAHSKNRRVELKYQQFKRNQYGACVID